MTTMLPPDEASLIRADHLTKLALVYIRQSTLFQVRMNTGSTEDQRGLTDIPKRLGWPEGSIQLIDEDLGVSAKSAGTRSGFRSLLTLMSKGQVGLVVVQNESRVSRHPLDGEQFLDAARRFDVLIFTDGHLFAPHSADLMKLFGVRIKNLLSWYENEDRAQRFRAASHAKARRGFAVRLPQNGYVIATKGKWIKDPDAALREAVDRLSFDKTSARR